MRQVGGLAKTREKDCTIFRAFSLLFPYALWYKSEVCVWPPVQINLVDFIALITLLARFLSSLGAVAALALKPIFRISAFAPEMAF